MSTQTTPPSARPRLAPARASVPGIVRGDDVQPQPDERSYRRGYMHGMSYALDMMMAGKTLQQMLDHFNGPVSEWRFRYGDHGADHLPPTSAK